MAIENGLTAAARLFGEFGAADTTLERIASQAGLSHSAVLRQFASKLGVLMACANVIDAPDGTTTGTSWVHFAAELPDGHPVRQIVIERTRWYLEFLARELGQLGHQGTMGTAAILYCGLIDDNA